MSQTDYTADDLKKLPLRAIVAFAVRCARRVEHLALPPAGHPEKDRWTSAIAAVLDAAGDFARGVPDAALESAVLEIEAGRGAAQGEIVRENAYAAVVRAAHAAATAAHSLAERAEPVERRLVSGGPPIQPLAHLADVTAELAALEAYTAALDAAEAAQITDGFSTAAAADYRKLLELRLGVYPEAGDPIDPSPEGPLGPLRPAEGPAT